jgi:hypothetical protein
MVPGVSRRMGVVMLAALAMLLGAPRPAPAAVTCEFSSGVLFVDLGASSDLAQVSVSGANIVVRDLFGLKACTGTAPTVNNTAALSIFNHPGFNGNTVIVETAGAFAPGPAIQDGSDNAGGTPEIEIFVNLNSAPNGLLSVRGQGGNIRFGGFGINPNASATEVQPDVDITPLNVSRLDGRAGSSASATPATLGAQGGAGTGPPLTQGIDLQGNNGADNLTGGDGADTLQSFAGNDNLVGGSGDDAMEPGADNDAVDGGAGADTANYSQFGVTSIAVDLDIAGPQNTGGSGNDSIANIENVTGTSGPDILRGNGESNRLTTFNGNDVVEGRGGNDTLDAGGGEDTLDVRDDGPDSAECGAGTDTVTADLAGIDTLLNCETAVFPATASGNITGGPTVVADTAAPSVTGPTADPKRFEVDPKGKRETAVKSARKGTTFKFGLSEAATVTFTIERKASGRRVKGKCARRTKSNAKRKKCDLFRRVTAFRASGSAGANGKKFSGRIGNITLKPASYRALLTAVDKAGNRSQPARIAFTVVKAKSKRRR